MEGKRRRVAVLGLGERYPDITGADTRSRRTTLGTIDIFILAVAVLTVVFVKVCGSVAGIVGGDAARSDGAVSEVVSAEVGVGATAGDLGQLKTDWHTEF